MGVYKLPDEKFLSTEHDLIKAAVPSADEEAMQF